MIYFIPALIVFFMQLYLLISWLKMPRKTDRQAMKLCLWGFLLGEAYLFWEVFLIKLTGKPFPGSTEQKILMARLALGGSLGGLFTIIGLFYVSFASYGQLKKPGQRDN